MEESGKQSEVRINYETLYEILLREKRHDEPGALDRNFHANLADYLSNKMALLDETRNRHDLFSTKEQSETRTQLENIRRLLSEIYERREKKILLMALNKSRTGSSLIDTSSLLDTEQALFEEVRIVLDRHRSGVHDRLLHAKLPELPSPAQGLPPQPNQGPPQGMKEKKETRLIRFLRPVPKFVGKELEVYGPFEEDDMASLPAEIADVLIAKGRGEEVQGEPLPG